MSCNGLWVLHVLCFPLPHQCVSALVEQRCGLLRTEFVPVCRLLKRTTATWWPHLFFIGQEASFPVGQQAAQGCLSEHFPQTSANKTFLLTGNCLVGSPDALDVSPKNKTVQSLVLDKDRILSLWVLDPNLEPWSRKISAEVKKSGVSVPQQSFSCLSIRLKLFTEHLPWDPEHTKLLSLRNDPGTVFQPGEGFVLCHLSPEVLRDRLSSGYGSSLGNSFFSHCAKLIGPCGNWTYALRLINTIAY